MLKGLFIPSDTYFSSNLNTIMSDLSNRLSYNSYLGVFQSVQNVTNGTMPVIALDGVNIGGMTFGSVTIVDWTWFNSIRNTWYGWVRGSVFIFLVIYNINNVYRLVRNGTLTSAGTFIGKAGKSNDN